MLLNSMQNKTSKMVNSTASELFKSVCAMSNDDFKNHLRSFARYRNIYQTNSHPTCFYLYLVTPVACGSYAVVSSTFLNLAKNGVKIQFLWRCKDPVLKPYRGWSVELMQWIRHGTK